MTFKAAVILIGTICVAFALAGCVAGQLPPTDLTPTPTPPPFRCDRFMQNDWREFQFGVDTPDDVVARVVEKWGIDKDDFGIMWDPPSYWVSWEEGIDFFWSNRQKAVFDTREKLMHIVVNWSRRISSMPTLAQVLDCLGTPDYYSAALVEDGWNHWFKFDLWFMEQGLFVQGSFNVKGGASPTGAEAFPTAIRPETLMGSIATHALLGDVIAVAPTQDIAQMVSDVYGTSLLAWELCLIRPWPGSIEAIEILSYEEYLRCAT